MLALNARLRVWVAAEPADFRCGIDGLARRVRQKLTQDPFSGGVFVFCNRRRTAVKLLVYDGQGFWLCQKRLSQGHYRFWPQESPGKLLAPHALAVLLSGGDYAAAGGIPEWRAVVSFRQRCEPPVPAADPGPRVARGPAATRRQPAAATLDSPPFGTLEIVALPG